MSTLISDLDGVPAQGDGDFVQNILNEINGGGGTIQAPPAVGGMAPGTVISAPNPNTIAPRQMDNAPIMAHMIGNSHPTPADFAQMMGAPPSHGQVAAAPQGGEGVAGAAASWAQPAAAPAYMPRAKRSWTGRMMEEFRTPMLVAILVFVVSLPVVNFLFAHYLPSMVKPTGELTAVGLVIKSLGAGGAFWLLQRVIVPLLTS